MGRGIALRGSRVLISGGGSGLGRLLALGAAHMGAKVVVWDLSPERADAVRDEILRRGGTADSYAVDVTNQAEVAKTALRVGDIDVLINNAGVVGGRPILEETESSIRRTIEVNLLSLFWVTRAFLPGMTARRSGYVVTIASAAGLVGVAKQTDYAASKFGAFGFNESLHMEQRALKTGIHTMIVCPYYMNTGMFDGVKSRFPLLLPILNPNHVAAKVLLGIEKGSKQIIMPGLVRIVPLVRILPVAWSDKIADLMGLNQAMNDFRGRPSDRV